MQSKKDLFRKIFLFAGISIPIVFILFGCQQNAQNDGGSSSKKKTYSARDNYGKLQGTWRSQENARWLVEFDGKEYREFRFDTVFFESKYRLYHGCDKERFPQQAEFGNTMRINANGQMKCIEITGVTKDQVELFHHYGKLIRYSRIR